MWAGIEEWAARLGPVNAGRDAWGQQLPSALCLSPRPLVMGFCVKSST